MSKILAFKTEISAFLSAKQLIDEPILCHALGIDASLYQMTPKLVGIAMDVVIQMKMIEALTPYAVLLQMPFLNMLVNKVMISSPPLHNSHSQA